MRSILILNCILLNIGFSFAMAMEIKVKDRNIQDFLPWLATETGNSVILSPDIQARISLSLKDIDWNDLVALIAKQHNLELSWLDDTAMLMPTKQGDEQANSLTECDVYYWPIKNATAEKVSNHLQSLFPDFSFVHDSRTNLIMSKICRGSDTVVESVVESIVEAIAWLDTPRIQIEISARIAQVQTSSEEKIGVEWQALAGSGAVNLGATAPTSELSFSLMNDKDLLALNLHFLETQGLANIISEPKIVTEEGKTARIESGTEVPYQITDGEDTYVEFKQAGLTLEVTPYIKTNNQVQLELKIYQDAVGEIYNGVPSIDTNRITTQVVVADQETLVLGGIYRDEVWTTQSRVPFFGRLPFIGALFRKETERQEKVELLVFITPKLLQLSHY